MNNNYLRRTLAAFLSCTLFLSPVLSPIVRAAQLSLPASDLIAPTITQNNYIDKVAKNQQHSISVTVTDNVAVKKVTLYYRTIGDDIYKTQVLKNVPGSDEYQTTFKAELSCGTIFRFLIAFRITRLSDSIALVV